MSSCQAGWKVTASQAVAVAVVGVQDRRVLVGVEAPLHRLAGPERADRGRAVVRPPAALALEGFDQRRVVREEVAALQRRGLVADLVGGGGATASDGGVLRR